MQRWFWFGLIIVDEHVKLRQVHVSPVNGMYHVEMWSRGEAGGLWYITEHKGTFAQYWSAMETAREWMRLYCAGYLTIEEGEPPEANYRRAAQAPAGAASPTFWADALHVPADADFATVRTAFRIRVRQTHPDHEGGSNDECAKVIAAWEYIKAERGWK